MPARPCRIGGPSWPRRVCAPRRCMVWGSGNARFAARQRTGSGARRLPAAAEGVAGRPPAGASLPHCSPRPACCAGRAGGAGRGDACGSKQHGECVSFRLLAQTPARPGRQPHPDGCSSPACSAATSRQARAAARAAINTGRPPTVSCLSPARDPRSAVDAGNNRRAEGAECAACGRCAGLADLERHLAKPAALAFVSLLAPRSSLSIGTPKFGHWQRPRRAQTGAS